MPNAQLFPDSNPTVAIVGGSGVTDQTSALKIKATTNGSGVNGPGPAHTGHNITIEKNGWQDGPSSVGEIDGQYIHAWQGGILSDCSGQLIEVKRTSRSSGFLSATETATRYFDRNVGSPTFGQITRHVQIQTGAINTTVVGSINGEVLGVVASSRAGLGTAAFQAQNEDTGTWVDLFKGIQNGTTVFRVNAGGAVTCRNVIFGNVAVVNNATTDAGAAALGTPVGGIYRTDNALKVRLS